MQRPLHSETHRTYSKDSSTVTTKVIGREIEDVHGKD